MQSLGCTKNVSTKQNQWFQLSRNLFCFSMHWRKKYLTMCAPTTKLILEKHNVSLKLPNFFVYKAYSVHSWRVENGSRWIQSHQKSSNEFFKQRWIWVKFYFPRYLWNTQKLLKCFFWIVSKSVKSSVFDKQWDKNLFEFGDKSQQKPQKLLWIANKHCKKHFEIQNYPEIGRLYFETNNWASKYQDQQSFLQSKRSLSNLLIIN